MRTETKKKIWKSAKIGWLLIGILILVNAVFWWIKMTDSANVAVLIVLSVFLGYIAIIAYVLITILFLSIKWLIKVLRK